MARPATSSRLLPLAAAVACLSLFVALTRAGSAQAPPATETWYIVTLQGDHAGWMRHREETTDGRITTEVEWSLTVSRVGTPIESRKHGRFVETTEGVPISFWSLQDLGARPREVLYEFGPDRLVVKTTEGGQTSTSTRPLPEGNWQTPHAAGAFLVARLRGEADRITVTSVDTLGDIEPVTTVRELLERESTIEARGKRIRATKWKTVQSSLPSVAATEYFDPQGVLVRSEVEVGGVSIVTQLSDESVARRVGIGPEMMLKTFVRPSRPIARPARLKKGVFELSVEEGELPEIPSSGAQAVERAQGDAERVRVTVDIRARTPADGALDEFLSSSPLITSDDDHVKDLAQRAARSGGRDPMRRAEAIRSFVHRYIRSKSLGVGLASAAEVAREREGDCTEHAVLTTAMLRAVGIPARIATGLVLVEEFAGQKSIFGYHMWSQGQIDGAWVDFDATLSHRFDATHIALSLSAMNEADFLGEMARLLPLMGRLKVDVVDLEY